MDLLKIDKVRETLTHKFPPALLSSTDVEHRKLLYRSVFVSIQACFKEMFDHEVLDIRFLFWIQLELAWLRKHTNRSERKEKREKEKERKEERKREREREIE